MEHIGKMQLPIITFNNEKTNITSDIFVCSLDECSNLEIKRPKNLLRDLKKQKIVIKKPVSVGG